VNFGLAPLATYTFLGVGFWIVMTVALGLVLVYAVGSSRGRRAAQAWTSGCMLVLAVAGIADIVWAVVSGQWRSFMIQFGFSPLAELMVLATLFLGTLWWMAVRYAAGIKD
jgi:hypothetical protein